MQWRTGSFASLTGVERASTMRGPVIHRICAVSFVVLIALPFTAPCAVCDLRGSAVRGRATAIVEMAAAAAPDDGPVWSDRSDRLHHAMPLAALNSGYASPDVASLYATPLPPSAVTSVPHNTAVIATVLRI
jgi:hypothetical protein